MVTADGKNGLAVIPGIFKAKRAEDSITFVQVLSDSERQCRFYPFPVEQFEASEKNFHIQIANCHFSDQSIRLDLEGINGEIRIDNPRPWPVRLHSPGIMGWYAWAPFMQCYHGVVSLDHRLDGRLFIDGESIDFCDGRGYTEKDWGRAFPESWIWVQSNHFQETGVSLTASLAIIPWITGAFPGFIIGVWMKDRLYRFATYTGARIVHLKLNQQILEWEIRDRKHLLRLTVYRDSRCGTLRAPTGSGMNRIIEESLRSQVDLELFRISGGTATTIFSGKGEHAGVEMVGNLEKLIGMWAAQEKTDR